MMLEWLEGEEVHEAGRRIRAAVASVLSDPSARTPDMGGRLSTSDMGSAVAAALAAQ
jgi:isocitrate/isopropylmalate dehydrogenase